MARIRQFKPSFFTDDKVGRLSRDARLFFFGLLSEADDEGRLVDAPKRLAGVIYPFDEDVTPKKVAKWIDELVAQQMVLRYTHEGGNFLYIRKFKAHQKMSHPTPSTLPPPPSGPGQSAGRPPEKLRRATGAPPEDFAPVFEGVSVSEGVGVVEAVGVPGDRSSSSNGSAEPAAAEEEEPDFVVSRAVRIAAERRLASRTTGQAPVVDRESWLAKTVSTIRLQLGDALAELAAQGADVDALVAAINPPPMPAASPYPSPGEKPEPAYDEVLVDGEWKLVSRVGA